MTTMSVVPVRDLVERRYAATPDRVAFVDATRELTYAELGRCALRTARGLQRLGVTAGDRVVVVGDNSCDWVVLEHALYLGGFVRVAALTRLHPGEVERIAADADAAVVVADAQWLQTAGTQWLPACVQHTVAMGREVAGTRAFVELAAEDETPFPPIDPDALTWIAYTSGSTGLPKGVTYTQRTLGAMLRNLVAEIGEITAEDVALHTAPLSHFSGALELTVFLGGGKNLLHRSFDAAEVIRAIEQDKVTILPLVPTQISMLTEALRAQTRAGQPVDLSSVRLLPYAGSAIAPDRLAAALEYFGGTLMQFYGAQEAPMPLTCLRPEDHVPGTGVGGLPRLASAGRKTKYVGLKIVDPDGAELPAGEVGEIATRGDQITRGYWRNPEGTAQVLSQNGWLYTGDMGYVDEDGFLFIVDRKKDMIVTGGFNVFPREVENVVSTLAGVREVAVVGAPSQRWGESITAVVSLTSGSTITAEDVVAHCRQLIAGFKVPKQVVFVDDLPKGGTGKILKPEIRRRLWADHERNIV